MCYLFTVPGVVIGLDASFSDNGVFDPETRMYTVDLIATWEDPVYPNGVITSYELNLTLPEHGEILYSISSIVDRAVTESVIVLPYTNYTVVVAASTSAGQGDPESTIALSPEAGKSLYQSFTFSIPILCMCMFNL